MTKKEFSDLCLAIKRNMFYLNGDSDMVVPVVKLMPIIARLGVKYIDKGKRK